MSQTLPVKDFVSEGNVRPTNRDSLDYLSLKENIKEIGMETPITYRLNKDGQAVIVNGHQRVQIAKDLRMKEIPCYRINSTVDDKTRQLSSNLYSVPMTTFEASSAVSQIMKDNPKITKKQLQKKFGKHSAWINEAVLLANVSNEIMDSVRIDDFMSSRSTFHNDNEYFNETIGILMDIGRYSKEVQEQAILNLSEEENVPPNELFQTIVTEYYDLKECLDALLDEIRPYKLTFEDILEHVDKKTFRQCEKDAMIEHTYTHSLFKEYEDEKFCMDKEFLAYVFSNHTESGKKFFNDLPIDTDMRGWDNDVASISWKAWSSPSSFYSELKNSTKTPYSEVELNSWNGRVTNPLVKYSIKKVDKKGTVVDNERDVFQSSYNKTNKLLYEIVKDLVYAQVDTSKNNKDNQNIVFKWLLTETCNVPDFGVPYYYDDEQEDYHPASKMENIKGSPLNNSDLINSMTEVWFDQFYDNVTYDQLCTLFKNLGLTELKTQIAEKYKKDESFRESYLKCFSLDALRHHGNVIKATNKKVAIEMAKESPNFPFANYLFTVHGQSSKGLLKEYAN